MKKIAIIGTGAYGLSIALTLLKKHETVSMWVESKEKAEYYDKHRKNSGILPNTPIPDNIEFSSDYKEVIKNTNIIFIAVAAKFLDSVCKDLAAFDTKNKHFCILSKGIEQKTCNFATEVFKRNIKTKNISIISGPTFAIDIANDEPVGLTIASDNKKSAETIKRVLQNDKAKLRYSNDTIGVELCVVQ